MVCHIFKILSCQFYGLMKIRGWEIEGTPGSVMLKLPSCSSLFDASDIDDDDDRTSSSLGSTGVVLELAVNGLDITFWFLSAIRWFKEARRVMN